MKNLGHHVVAGLHTVGQSRAWGASMLIIPFKISPSEYSVFVVLEDENLDRMRQYDPAEVGCAKLGMGAAKLKDIIIGWANAEDLRRVMELCGAGKPQEALQFLSRGFKYRPGAGDHDGPYLSVKPDPSERKH